MNEEAYYSGVEPVEVGDLTSVQELRQVIPATRGVKVLVRKAEHRGNEANTFRSINLELLLSEGILSEGTEGEQVVKYKGKVVFARVCYYADPEQYTKDFFKNKQHLVQLKYLGKATGVDLTQVDGHKIDELVGKEVLVDIGIRKRQVFEAGQPVKDENGENVYQQENEVRNYKVLALEQEV